MEEIPHHLGKLPTSTGEFAGFLPSTVPFHHLSLKIDLIPSWVLVMTTGRPSWKTRIQAMFARNGVFFPGFRWSSLLVRCLFLKVEKHTKNHGTENYSLPGFCHMCVFFFFVLFGWNHYERGAYLTPKLKILPQLHGTQLTPKSKILPQFSKPIGTPVSK